MIPLRLIVPAVLAAAAAAGCFTYFASRPAQVDADQRLSPTKPNLTGPASGTLASMDHRAAEEERVAAAYQRAAEAILRRAPNARAFAGADESPIKGPVPLPKARPFLRP